MTATQAAVARRPSLCLSEAGMVLPAARAAVRSYWARPLPHVGYPSMPRPRKARRRSDDGWRGKLAAAAAARQRVLAEALREAAR
jgi:hypothetical protein